mmetsp:Transcript_94162/g.210543  ORF Transcript_94162/g.210543 Transcript_94162/m.210543 type:complete len:508 (-) Transcript_94162:52-1575(-)
MEAFYGCYLLESLQRKQQTYIGFTMDPRRRLRQHNGEITAGACKTKKWRPWKMVLCVWGFPNKISALQFEYAWQHPAICRHVRDQVAHLAFCQLTRVGRQRLVLGAEKNLKVLLQMLQARPYCGMPLRLHILDPEIHDKILPKLPAARKLPGHIQITKGSFDDLERLCVALVLATSQPVSGDSCVACGEAFCAQDRLVTCPSCECPFHVSCAAQAFVGPAASRLMPRLPAACPKCSASCEWPVLVRTARRFAEAPPAAEALPAASSSGALPECSQEVAYDGDSDSSLHTAADDDRDGEEEDSGLAAPAGSTAIASPRQRGASGIPGVALAAADVTVLSSGDEGKGEAEAEASTPASPAPVARSPPPLVGGGRGGGRGWRRSAGRGFARHGSPKTSSQGCSAAPPKRRGAQVRKRRQASDDDDEVGGAKGARRKQVMAAPSQGTEQPSAYASEVPGGSHVARIASSPRPAIAGKSDAPGSSVDLGDEGSALRSRLFKKRCGDASVFGI